MNCLVTRELLVERSLATLSSQDESSVDRHLAWCAACRKEAAGLDGAAATFALVLAPASPPLELEDRVIEAVHSAIDRAQHRRWAPRARSASVAALVAALVTVGALGWGAAMAGRAERFRDRAAQAESQQASALEQFRVILGQSVFEQPGNRAYLGTLAPGADGSGGGSALTLISPSITDFVVVTVSGLPPGAKDAMPYRVWISNDAGDRLPVGDPIRELDADGGAMRVQNAKDLAGYQTVTVTDASGAVVLRGQVGTVASVASPTP